MPAAPTSTGVAITNPLVLYRALIATKRIVPDPAQYRLAVHLQKLYDRLKDYEPIVEYSHRLNQISRTLSNSPTNTSYGSAEKGRPECDRSPGFLSSLFQQKKEKETLALTRVLTSHEKAKQMDSPQGLMLHGEVGTGKSMLIDLFADCLPNRKKKRWHFSTFMLEVLAKLEQLRRSRQLIVPSSLGQEDEYSLLWLAREMISTSPILFLDEFQLPDRTASKIMTNLMTCFFHLGGVLIATSNRMPEELAKAAGVEFRPPPSRLDSLRWNLGFARSGRGITENPYPGAGDFAAFLDVLKARCEVLEMESGKDYRRREAEVEAKEIIGEEATHHLKSQGFEDLESVTAGGVGIGIEGSEVREELKDYAVTAAKVPKNYLVKPADSDSAIVKERWAKDENKAKLLAVGKRPEDPQRHIPWSTDYVRVYGRDVLVPRQYEGVTSWTFAELCVKTFGPADYITLASTYHTFIVTDVPILSVLQKNEARRFITLLDALYEAKCKLLITAQAGPDEIFFPDRKITSHSGLSDSSEETVSEDAILPETLSGVYQDATSPFRPNIASYDESYSTAAPLEPDFTHSRLAGILSDHQLEDGPPNSPRRSSQHAFGRGDSIFGMDVTAPGSSTYPGAPNFLQTGIFTGEDEKFAYKRARSRLWEMCGARWWARNEDGWWKPLDRSVRTWERSKNAIGMDDMPQLATKPAVADIQSAAMGEGEGMRERRNVSEEDDAVMFKHGASPFRSTRNPPPKFQWTHFWGMMKWGKKAGVWGQGVESLEGREKERIRMKQDADNEIKKT